MWKFQHNSNLFWKLHKIHTNGTIATFFNTYDATPPINLVKRSWLNLLVWKGVHDIGSFFQALQELLLLPLGHVEQRLPGYWTPSNGAVRDVELVKDLLKCSLIGKNFRARVVRPLSLQIKHEVAIKWKGLEG